MSALNQGGDHVLGKCCFEKSGEPPARQGPSARQAAGQGTRPACGSSAAAHGAERDPSCHARAPRRSASGRACTGSGPAPRDAARGGTVDMQRTNRRSGSLGINLLRLQQRFTHYLLLMRGRETHVALLDVARLTAPVCQITADARAIFLLLTKTHLTPDWMSDG